MSAVENIEPGANPIKEKLPKKDSVSSLSRNMRNINPQISQLNQFISKKYYFRSVIHKIFGLAEPYKKTKFLTPEICQSMKYELLNS